MKLFMTCDCGTPWHIFCFERVDDCLYLQVAINPYLPWYKRIGAAIKYVFNRGHAPWDSVVISDETKLKEFFCE